MDIKTNLFYIIKNNILENDSGESPFYRVIIVNPLWNNDYILLNVKMN